MKTTMVYDIIYVKNKNVYFFQLWLTDAGINTKIVSQISK